MSFVPSSSQWGSPAAPKRALLLHGSISSSHAWESVGQRLAEAGRFTFPLSCALHSCIPGFHVVAPNLLGHGYRKGSTYELNALAEFRLKDRTADRIARSYALNTERLAVYNYDAFKPEENFNILLEDIPLEGLWPWPNRAGRRENGWNENRDVKGGRATLDDNSEGEASGFITPDSTDYDACLHDYSTVDDRIQF